jgi:hypothetical protein
MKHELAHSKGQTLGGQRGGRSHSDIPPSSAAVASSIAKPEFKKHIHTNTAKGKPDHPAAQATGAMLSRRQLKNLAKRKKKEAAAAAAAAGQGSNSPSSSSAPLSTEPSSAAGDNTSTRAKKAPLDPGKKAEVNCNWQALKKALVSGGPIITRSLARISVAAR